METFCDYLCPISHVFNAVVVLQKEFNDLLTKLQDKIQQASNMMRCDNCGGKHKRTPVERPWYSARYCDRCSIRHSAKEVNTTNVNDFTNRNIGIVPGIKRGIILNWLVGI